MPVAYSANHALYMRTRDTPGLEGTCRTISKAFSSCVTDRNDGDQSLKWCVYKLANLLLRAYFRLGATHLCLNIIRTIENASVYELGMYPASDRVTWWYYSGVLKFRQQEYHAAYELLKQAFDHVAGQDMARHRDQILEYLVPLGMLRGLYPPKTLCLGYNKLISAVSRGDLQTYEQQVDRFPRVLLLLEQLRGVLVRNAVVRAHADLQSTRIPLGVLGMDEREAAMLLVNCIDAGLVKGYLSHAGHVLVLSKLQPFPLL